MFSTFYNKVFALYLGRDLNYGPGGYLFSLLLIPRRDLTPEGYLIYSGLSVEVFLSLPNDYTPRRFGVRCWVRSDADKISRLLAGIA